MCHPWHCQADTIIDVRITDMDAKSYILKLLEKALLAQDKEKKANGWDVWNRGQYGPQAGIPEASSKEG
eukprot:13224539-Ditylum_brightwellii.AAC.2